MGSLSTLRLLPASPAAVALLGATLFSSGCAGNIHELYERSRAEAMADPGPLPASWAADLVLELKWDVVDALLADTVNDRLSKGDHDIDIALPLGNAARIHPDWRIAEMTVGPSQSCASCARLRARFVGTIHWSVGPLEGEIPANLGLGAKVEIVTETTEKGVRVAADVRGVEAKLDGSPVVQRFHLDLDSPIAEWLKQRFAKELPRVDLAEIGEDDAGVRAIRVLPQDESLRIEGLTTSPIRSEPPSVGPIEGDWGAAMSETVLLGLARRAAFQQEAMTYDIHAEPRAIRLNGNRFVMDLRLWRLEGRGWWRDYEVQGELGVAHGKLELHPDNVAKTDASAGAGLADPLAALGQGYILTAIENGATMAKPAQTRQSLGSHQWTVSLEQVSGGNGALVVEGIARTAGESR
jgi:hypothetical protein